MCVVVGWRGSPTLTVFSLSEQGGPWQNTELAVPFRPTWPFSLAWTPGGDLIGRQDGAFYPDGSFREGEGLRLWRASPDEGGAFEVVHGATSGTQISWNDVPITVFGDQLWASRLWSDDDGHTWTELSPWR